jgi:hypothetical protein
LERLPVRKGSRIASQDKQDEGAEANGKEDEDFAELKHRVLKRIRRMEVLGLLHLNRWPQWVESQAIIEWAVRRSHISCKALGLQIPEKVLALDEVASLLNVDPGDIILWQNTFVGMSFRLRRSPLFARGYPTKYVRLFAHIKYMMHKRRLGLYEVREHIREQVRKKLVKSRV